MARKELTARQIKAAILEASPESWELTQVEKAKRIGINHTTLGRWQKLPAYREYVSKLIKEHAERMLPYAWDCLKKRMKNDTQALKLYFSLLGEYKQQLEVSGPGKGPIRLAWLANLPDNKLEEMRKKLLNE